MKSREELRESYEEALFAVIMEDLMELQGADFAAAEQRLSAAESEVPEAVDKRCAAYIKALIQKREAERKAAQASRLRRTLPVAVIVMSLCFAAVCATIPAVKAYTMNLFRYIGNEVVGVPIGEYSRGQNPMKYVADYVPDGFVLTDEYADASILWKEYRDGSRRITVSVICDAYDWVYEADIENAVYSEMTINNLKGYVIERPDEVHFVLLDENAALYVEVIGSHVDKERLIEMIKEIRWE